MHRRSGLGRLRSAGGGEERYGCEYFVGCKAQMNLKQRRHRNNWSVNPLLEMVFQVQANGSTGRYCGQYTSSTRASLNALARPFVDMRTFRNGSSRADEGGWAMLCVSSPNPHSGWTIAGTGPERPEGLMVAWDAALFTAYFFLWLRALKAPSTSAKSAPRDRFAASPPPSQYRFADRAPSLHSTPLPLRPFLRRTQ
jgi:hypothetical protein